MSRKSYMNELITKIENMEPMNMVFDWCKAAEIIKEIDPEIVSAFIKGQREETGGIIWKDGKPCLTDYTFLQSRLDPPMIDYDGTIEECWTNPADTPNEFQKRLEEDHVIRAIGRWYFGTKWPESALAILGLNFHEVK